MATGAGGFEGAREVDYRGRQFVLGRTADAYAIWRLTGGPPVRTFPLTDQAWPEAWLTYQAWEAGVASPSGERPPVETAAAWQTGPGYAGPVMDFPGGRYGLGRAQGRYYIWDLEARSAVESFPQDEGGWRDAWGRFQELDRPYVLVPTSQWRKGQPIPVRAMRAGQIVAGAFRLYFMNFWLLVGLTAAILLPVLAITGVATFVLLETMPVQTGVGTVETVQAPFWINLITWLLGALAGSVLTPALVTAVIGSVTGRQPHFGLALREGFRLLGPILWVTFLLFLVILVLLIPAILLAVALAFNPTSAVLGVLYILVLLASFVPIYYVVIRFLFAMSIVVVEGRRGADALRRSWNLVRGLGWKVFGNFLLVALVAAGVALPVLLIGTIILSIVAFAGVGSGGFTTGAAIAFFVGFFVIYSILLLFLVPFQMAGIQLQYLDTRVRKEGLTEEALAREFQPGGAGSPAGVAPPPYPGP